MVADLIHEAKKYRMGVRVLPQNPEELFLNSELSYLGTTPLITYKERVHHPSDFIIKRLVDFFVSLILSILLVPVGCPFRGQLL